MSADHAKRPAFEPAARLLTPTRYDPTMRRPVATRAGVALLVLRVLAGAVVVVDAALRPGSVVDLTVDGASLTLAISLAVAGTVLLIDALFATLIWAGFNWPRVVVMLGSVVSISTAFVGWWSQGQQITLKGSLVSVALDVLVLLALSSRSAAAYARRNQRR